jgi:hypothetical protein
MGSDKPSWKARRTNSSKRRPEAERKTIQGQSRQKIGLQEFRKEEVRLAYFVHFNRSWVGGVLSEIM